MFFLLISIVFSQPVQQGSGAISAQATRNICRQNRLSCFNICDKQTLVNTCTDNCGTLENCANVVLSWDCQCSNPRNFTDIDFPAFNFQCQQELDRCVRESCNGNTQCQEECRKTHVCGTVVAKEGGDVTDVPNVRKDGRNFGSGAEIIVASILFVMVGMIVGL